jgi:hypothetical protein
MHVLLWSQLGVPSCWRIKLNIKIQLQSIEPVNTEKTIYRTKSPLSLEAPVDPSDRAILSQWAKWVRIDLSKRSRRVGAFIAWRRKQRPFPKQCASSKIRRWTKYKIKMIMSMSHIPSSEPSRFGWTVLCVCLCRNVSHHCFTEFWYYQGRWRNV